MESLTVIAVSERVLKASIDILDHRYHLQLWYDSDMVRNRFLINLLIESVTVIGGSVKLLNEPNNLDTESPTVTAIPLMDSETGPKRCHQSRY